ncbi:multicopper oxidase family protein [Geitlerinema sp. PCC 9228]|uniref:multicopper oxidase family protein n=1 Tax=Geitlerinema sp. PCC 9228 TaxID=111611 RepID=UPI0008F9CFF6|nr:multicopper oxidase family protein [Geitlerinema sp. PCC 9228]
MNRRQFLALSTSATAAVFLGRCALPKSDAISQQQQNHPSQDGLLDLDLTASYNKVSLGNQPAYLLNYNQQVPGPLLEAKPGDTVRIRFTNRLSESTNLHYHGLHVSPTGNADNIFIDVPSQETFTYEFQIPSNHPAGLFWYHPHYHGLVASQVAGGLAGLLVVRGELDELPVVKAAREEFLVLQDFSLGNNNRLVAPNHMSQMLGREGNVITGNGRTNPQLMIPQGGWLRLRLLNASPSRFYRLALPEHPFYVIATDGGAVTEPIEMSELLLSPGERIDVLISGNRQPGEYRLLNLPYDRGTMGMMGGRGMMGRGHHQRRKQESAQSIATVTYSRESYQNQSPPKLPEKLIPVESLPEASNVRRFTLNHGMEPGMGMAFLINGRAFSGSRIDTQVALNSVEDWEIRNIGGMDHPFHLHTNPFQIISRRGASGDLGILPVQSDRYWKDVVLVRSGETVRIRTRFQDFAGKTVYHCHILDHEDLGMMGTIRMQA